MTKYNAMIRMTALALTNASEKSSVNRNTLVITYLYITNITIYIHPNPLHMTSSPSISIFRKLPKKYFYHNYLFIYLTLFDFTLENCFYYY